MRFQIKNSGNQTTAMPTRAQIKAGKQHREQSTKDLYRDALPLIRQSLIRRGLDDYYALGDTGAQDVTPSIGDHIDTGIDVGTQSLDFLNTSSKLLGEASNKEIWDKLYNASDILGEGLNVVGVVRNIMQLPDAPTTEEKISQGTDVLLDALDTSTRIISTADPATKAWTGPLRIGISGLQAIKSAVDMGRHVHRWYNIESMKSEVNSAAAKFGYHLDDPSETAAKLHKAFYDAQRSMSAQDITTGSSSATKSQDMHHYLDAEEVLAGFQKMMQRQEGLLGVQLQAGIDSTEAMFDCVSNIISFASNICDIAGAAAPVGIALGTVSLVLQAASLATTKSMQRDMHNKIIDHNTNTAAEQRKAALLSAGICPDTGKTPSAKSGGTAAPKGIYASRRLALRDINEIVTDVIDEVYEKLAAAQPAKYGVHQDSGINVLEPTREKTDTDGGKAHHGYYTFGPLTFKSANYSQFKRIILYEMGVPTGRRSDISSIISIRNASLFCASASSEQNLLRAKALLKDSNPSQSDFFSKMLYTHQLSLDASIPTVRMLERLGGLKKDDKIALAEFETPRRGPTGLTRIRALAYIPYELPEVSDVAEKLGANTKNLKKLHKTSAANPFVTNALGNPHETDADAQEAYQRDYRNLAGGMDMSMDQLTDEQRQVRQVQLAKRLMRGDSLRYTGSRYGLPAQTSGTP